MIGQKNLQEDINNLIAVDNYPHYSIFVGVPGSGRKTISKLIASKLGATFTIVGTSVEEIRKLIDTAYKSDMPVVYCVADADGMSSAARNALLKLTEEPPKSAYIVMTFADSSNIMATLKSRAHVFEMEMYRAHHIQEYYESKYSGDDIQLIRDFCTVPGQVDMLAGKVQEFNDFVNKVADNITEASISNVFKIADSIKLKETDEDKWDLRLFWEAFSQVAVKKSFVKRVVNTTYLQWVVVTGYYVNDLKIVGLNKSAAFAMWIVDIRGCPWN